MKFLPKMNTRMPRRTGSPFSPQRVAKYSAAIPKAPASSVAKPLLIHFDKVPPKEKKIHPFSLFKLL